MLKQILVHATVFAVLGTNAYAAVAPEPEEKEFPLAIVFALIAVACGVGTAIMASQSKKKD